MLKKIKAIGVIAVLCAVLAGCAGIRPTVFLHPQYSFNYLERVAVIPFENLSKDQGAAIRVTRLFTVELWVAEAFDVVEPGEVTRVLDNLSMVRTADLTQEQIIEIGKELNVQGIFLGSVNEFSGSRGSASSSNTVTLVVRLVETDKGETVWSSTHTEQGRGFWSSMFGTGEKSQSVVTRKCVKRIIGTLVN